MVSDRSQDKTRSLRLVMVVFGRRDAAPDRAKRQRGTFRLPGLARLAGAVPVLPSARLRAGAARSAARFIPRTLQNTQGVHPLFSQESKAFRCIGSTASVVPSGRTKRRSSAPRALVSPKGPRRGLPRKARLSAVLVPPCRWSRPEGQRGGPARLRRWSPGRGPAGEVLWLS